MVDVPLALQHEHRFLPMGMRGDVLAIGVERRLTARALDDLSFATGKRIEQEVIGASEIERHLAGLAAAAGPTTSPDPIGVPEDQAIAGQGGSPRSEQGGRGPEGGDGMTTGSVRGDRSSRRDRASDPPSPALVDDLGEGPVVQQVDRLIHRAVELGASDIHIEPYEQLVRVRYRLDGVLHLAGELRLSQRDAVVSRIKVLAALDIAEKRRPQDGRIRVLHGLSGLREPYGTGNPTPMGRASTGRPSEARPIDLRVSVLPTQFGEKVVLRILDRGSLRLDLEALGLGRAAGTAFRRAIEAPYGMVLVTGPTGSGKTTTLYAALSTLATERLNITTVEDPIEYDIEGVNQTQARPDIGFSFAEALRSFLRQDPDVIMVGEVRDAETADVAIRSALTGHLVLSTLHTNDAPSTVTRLVDMGIEPYLVAASVRLAVAQRLMRGMCPHCKEPVGSLSEGPDGPLLSASVSEALEALGPTTLYRGAGCAACGGTGYRGRTAVFEVMPVSESVARLITRGASAQEIRQQAEEEGMESLRTAALRKLVAGETTVEEVVRVTSS